MENYDKEKNMKKTLGKRIHEERLKKGWTIEQLAENMDLTPSFMGSVERGEKALSLKKAYRASEIFHVTIDSLVKSTLEYDSRTESFNLLLKNLNDDEYAAIYDIAITTKKHLKK